MKPKYVRMKLSALFPLLALTFTSLAQQPGDLKYVQIFKPSVKQLVYSPYLSTPGHNLCRDVKPASFGTQLRNTGNSTITNIVFRGLLYDNQNNLLDSAKSLAISLAPGDTSLELFLPPFQLPMAGRNFFRIDFFCEADNITPSDFLQANGPVHIDLEYNNRIGLDFGYAHNDMGTRQLGDSSAMGFHFDIGSATDFDSLGIHYSSVTQAGGSITVNVYDTAGFGFSSGFPTAPLYSKTFSVGSSAAGGNYVKYNLRDQQGNPVSLAAGTYCCVVVMRSQGGQYPVAIHNDQSINFTNRSSIFYHPGDDRWYSGFANVLDFNAPHIRLYANKNSIVSCATLSTEEVELPELSISPNPVSNKLRVSSAHTPGYPNRYSIINVRGKSVLAGQLTSTEAYIETGFLPAGIYVLFIHHTGQAIRFVKH